MPRIRLHNFSVGDRVVLIQDYPDNNLELRTGQTGTVVALGPYGYEDDSKNTYGVAYDAPFSEGHNLNGETDDNNGWWTPGSYLDFYHEVFEEIPDESIASLSDLLSMLNN